MCQKPFFEPLRSTRQFFLLFLAAFLFLFFRPVLVHGDVTVLIYHRFGESKYPTTNVATERFREQMAYLSENSFNVVPLSTLVRALKKGDPLPEKAVVITIDDGYKSTYTQAWPICKSFGYSFSVFLYGKAVDSGYRNFITWEQAREMAAAGVDFQDHGYSHAKFGSRPEGMDEDAYRAWIRADFVKSSRLLKEKLGVSPHILALPYGEYNSIVIEEAKKLDYAAVLTQDPGAVSEKTSPFAIPREPILGNDWATMDHFAMVLNRVDLPVAEIVPAIVPLTDNTPKRFGARLVYPDRYVPGSIGIYVSELGWHQAQSEGDFVYVANQAPLSRRMNRVLVSATEKKTGRTAVRYWLLIQE